MVAMIVAAPPAVAKVSVELGYDRGEARITARFGYGAGISMPVAKLPATMDLLTAKQLHRLLGAVIATAEGDS